MTKFLLELGRIGDPSIFLGVARILKVSLFDEVLREPRQFSDVFDDIMRAYTIAPRKRQRELYKILRAANEAQEGDTDNNTKNS